jgi:hypothetical protein
MKTKKILLIAIGTMFFFLSTRSHCVDVQNNILFATSEKAAYKLFDRMLDSARLSNRCLYPYSHDFFAISFFKELKGVDTIIKFEQQCGEYMGCNFYRVYLSCDMPIDFYERLLDYFATLDTKENYCIRDQFVDQYTIIRNVLIEQYESRKLLNKQDSLKVLSLIERASLESITRGHIYTFIYENDDEYMTDKIRSALINVMKHPFYPEEYYKIFMSYQDTSFVDTTNIPDTTRMKFIRNRNMYFYPEEYVFYDQLSKFYYYEEKGKEQGGLSPGQAYLKDVSKLCAQKGYLDIGSIEEYAYKKQDSLLIKHLKEFKKKHPDCPLKYF